MDHSNLADEQLIAAMARDESWALVVIYDRYARLVFSLAVRMLNDRSVAEEVVQEVFTKLWRSASDYSPKRGKFSSWLIGIAHHHCIDELRRRRVRPSEQSTDHPGMLELASDDDPAESAVAGLERARVKQALRRIPEEQRQVIEMAFFYGMTHSEIAAYCQEPLGTVKTRVRLGMQKLKELLAD